MLAFSTKITCLFVFAGLITVSKAIIETTLQMIAEPDTGYVFDNDTIRITCDVISNVNQTVTWHYREREAPAIKNSSDTTIITTTEGNRTFSVFTTTRIRPRYGKTLYIVCQAADENNKNPHSMYKLFTYVSQSQIPRLQVVSPNTHEIPAGDNRVLLSCHVVSNIDINQATVTWMNNNKLLSDTKVKLVAQKITNVSVLLQCLTKMHLGDYSCSVHANVYNLDWKARAVTSLGGTFLDAGCSCSGCMLTAILELQIVLIFWSVAAIFY